MPPASKKEAQAALTAARDKAQKAAEALREQREMKAHVNLSLPGDLDHDLAVAVYRRAVAEYEEALNTYNDLYDVGED